MERGKYCVYKNLAVQMLFQHVTRKKIAEKLHLNYRALCRKLNGETSISIEEAIAIYNIMNKVIPMDELFSRE